MKFFDGMKVLHKKNPMFIGFFFSISAISRERYHRSLMCDFYLSSNLYCLSLLFTTLTSNKIRYSLRESFMP